MRFTLFLSLCLFATVAVASPQLTPVTLVNAGTGSNQAIGPYTVDIGGVEMPALCIDLKDETAIGATWTAYLSPVIGGDFSATYLSGDPAAKEKYELEAYFFSVITTPGLDYSTITTTQNAAWQVTSTTNPLTPEQLASYQPFLASMDFSGYYVVSGYNNSLGNEQELLIDPGVPEPASIGLLGGGLIALGVASIRKRRRNRHS